MIPGTFVSLALFAFFITPGFGWVRVEERHSLRPERSPLMEAAELISIGAVASLLAAALVVPLGEELGFLLNVEAWLRAKEPSAYLRRHPWGATRSLIAVLALGNLGAYAAARTWHGRRLEQLRALWRRWVVKPQPHRIRVGNTVWFDVFGPVDKSEQRVHLTVVQDDGTTIDGFLLVYAPDARGSDQEFALQAPLQVREAGAIDFAPSVADVIVVPGDTVKTVYVKRETRSVATTD